MNDEMRANIVAKLRRTADRVEQGGDPPIVVRYGPDLLFEEADSPEEARAALDVGLHGDYWDESVDQQWWGVAVVVEEVACTEHRQALDTKDYDVWSNYAIVDPDTYTGPKVVPGYCRVCEQEVTCAPGETCPNECRLCGAHGDKMFPDDHCPECGCVPVNGGPK